MGAAPGGDRLAWFTGFLYLASALASLTTVAYLGGFWLGLLATGAPPSANGQVLCARCCWRWAWR